jgi:methylglutaconyl-CoA hydratase
MKYETLEVEIAHGVAVVWFNRPDVRNALNPVVLGEMSKVLTSLAKDKAVRAVVLGGRGAAFCAGADLKWMLAAASSKSKSTAKAAPNKMGGLEDVLHQLNTFPKPTVARIHGPAFAGGMGFVSACDIAVASTDAVFCLSEVKIGLIPAIISPYVVRAMGERMARRYFLTAERFDAAEAYRMGFVQELVQTAELDDTVNEILGQLVQGGPKALEASKQLIRDVAYGPITPKMRADTAKRIAAQRATPEGKEGIASFLEKRKPKWVTELGLE